MRSVEFNGQIIHEGDKIAYVPQGADVKFIGFCIFENKRFKFKSISDNIKPRLFIKEAARIEILKCKDDDNDKE